MVAFCRARAEPDGTRAEIRFRLSPKRTSPFKSAAELVQSIADSRGVRISVSNAGYTTIRGPVRVLANPSIRHFPFHFPPVRHRVPPHSERSIQQSSTLKFCVLPRIHLYGFHFPAGIAPTDRLL